MSKKLTESEFVKKAIKNLRKPPYKGIHTVYTRFNKEFRNYFGKDPKVATLALAKKGEIETRPVKGGALIYLKGEMPVYIEGEKPEKQPKESPTLAKILG